VKFEIKSIIFILFFGLVVSTLKDQNIDPIIKGKFFRQNLAIRNFFISKSFNIYTCFNENQNYLFDKLMKQGYVNTFFDDFNYFDTKKWRIGQPWGSFIPNITHQYYGQNTVYTANGCLYLIGKHEPKAFKVADSVINIPYNVGLINSDISFKQKFGFFEIRCKMPNGAATWPAFWLTGATRWPPEIDIFENYGLKNGKKIHTQSTTVHWGKDNHSSRGFWSVGKKYAKSNDTLFHTYACEWTPDNIKFFTDGKLIRWIKLSKKMKYWLNEEMVIIINNGFHDKYLSYLPSNFENNALIVDWIRVYKKY